MGHPGGSTFPLAQALEEFSQQSGQLLSGAKGGNNRGGNYMGAVEKGFPSFFSSLSPRGLETTWEGDPQHTSRRRVGQSSGDRGGDISPIGAT